MTTEETTSRGTVYNKVAVAYLQHIRSSTATRTFRTAMPRPTIVRDKSTAASAEGVVFSFAKSYSGRVMNIWCSRLSENR